MLKINRINKRKEEEGRKGGKKAGRKEGRRGGRGKSPGLCSAIFKISLVI